MTTKRAGVGRSGFAVLVAALVAACSPATPRPPQSVGISRCTVAYDERTLAECKHLALVKGDGKAALAVAKYYESPRHVSNDSAVEWYDRAADLGQLTAYRKLFDAYYDGSTAPQNIAKADEYLRRASEAGAEWAVLIVAKRLESSDPKAAVDRYLKVASDGNCYAQRRLADLYARDDFSGRSLTHAYFWSLLATVDLGRRFDGHRLLVDGDSPLDTARQAIGDAYSCAVNSPAEASASKLESVLPRDLVRIVQAAAYTWQRGNSEPLVLRSARTAEQARPTWKPFTSRVLPALSGTNNASDLFARVSKSVWLLIASRSEVDPRSATEVAFGSAVAVTAHDLVTNCHIIEDRTFLWVRQGDVVYRTRLTAADHRGDRCIVTVDEARLDLVGGMRPHGDIRVGEPVYTIGSPRGLERSLGQGIVSGVRHLDGVTFIQTTAQISRGSSGGGLFDASGNLIGVTTKSLIQSQGLNFAIAIDEYFRR